MADRVRALTASLIAGLMPFAVAFAQDAAPGDVAEAEALPTFDVFEIRVLGNTLLENAPIERVVMPHLGPGRTIDHVEEAREALEQAYKDAGFGTVFVDIPEQDVEGGIVRLQVTEGKVDRVRVTGARYFSNRRIRAMLPSMSPDAVPHLPTFQEELSALNQRSADRSITPLLRPGRRPGTVELELRVEDEAPGSVALEYNNRYTADTTETRASLTLGYDNLWQREHSISLQFQTSPEDIDETQVLAATYLLRPENSDRMMAFYAVDTNSDVSTLGDLTVLGGGNIYGYRFIQPLPSRENYFHTLILGADYKDFGDSVGFLDPEADPLLTEIAYLHFSAQYSATMPAPRGQTAFGVGANFGVRGLFNDREEFENKRFKGRPNYFYLNGEISRLQRFGDRFSLFARANGQITAEPLIANEQFSAGGYNTVRGYVEAEQLADYGAHASFEFRYSPLASKLGELVENLRFFTFFDWAGMRIHEPLPSQETRFKLMSAGAGMRFSAFDGLSAELDWAWPLRDATTTQADDQRLHFNLRYGF